MIEEKPKRFILCDLAMVLAFILGGASLIQFYDHLNPFQSDNSSMFFSRLLGYKYAVLDALSAITLMLLSVKIGTDEQRRVDNINRPWDVKQGDIVTDFYESKAIERELKYRESKKPRLNK